MRGEGEDPVDYLTTRADIVERYSPEQGLARRLSAATDAWLRELIEAEFRSLTGFSVVTTGSLARHEFLPYSDLDVAVVYPDAAHPDNVEAVRSAAARLWHRLWDAGLSVDHAVRSVGDTVALAADELSVVVAAVDARALAGDPAIAGAVRAEVLAHWRATAGLRLDDLTTARRARGVAFGELAELVEPDLKLSLGGQRDRDILRALAATWRAGNPSSAVSAASEHVNRVRAHLHVEYWRSGSTGSRADCLRRQHQAALAERLGVDSADDMLRQVAGSGRIIAAAVTRAMRSLRSWEGATESNRSSPRSWSRPPGPPRQPRLADGVVLAGGEIAIAGNYQLDTDPVLPLRLAAVSADQLRPIATSSLSRAAGSCPPLPHPWPPEARDRLRQLVASSAGIVDTWHQCDEFALFSRWVPGWESVWSLPQHNPYHRYTVDRHTIETVRLVPPVMANCGLGLERHQWVGETTALAALLHDIGKGVDGPRHSVVGAEMASDICRTWGLDDRTADTIVRLVRNHLLLPELATRRDIDDPSTIETVRSATGTPTELAMLYCLTVADALATGPAAHTSWRQRLIDQLVRAAGTGWGDNEEILSACLRAPTGPWVPDAFADRPDAFANRTAPGAVAEAAVVCPGDVASLARVAEIAVRRGWPVQSVRTEGRDRQRSFVVRLDVSGHGVAEATVQAIVDDEIRAVRPDATNGDMDTHGTMSRSTPPLRVAGIPAHRVSLTAGVLPGASQRSTVVRVRTTDGPGLLARIVSAVEAAECELEVLIADTVGREAIDTMYVQHRGESLNAHRQARLIDELQAASGD